MKQDVEKNNSCHRAPRLLRSCVKVAMTVVAIAIMFSAFTAPRNLRANEVSVAERWNQLVDLYIKNEFSNGNVKLRKFERVGPIAIVIDCGSLEQSVCQHAKQVLDESFEPSANVRLIPSPLGVITIVFDSSAQVEAKLPIAMKDYAGGVSDTSDRQCAMFYKFADSTIQQGKILASTDQAPNKLRACLIVQIGRLLGPGFSQTDRFLDAWDGILSLSSDDKLKQIGHIYGMLEYMHMCPELVAGMSEAEVHRALLNPTGCRSKLESIH